MTDDLVERLQEIALGYLAECNKAADRIEALEAENARLREAVEWDVAEDAKYIRAALEARHD